MSLSGRRPIFMTFEAIRTFDVGSRSTPGMNVVSMGCGSNPRSGAGAWGRSGAVNSKRSTGPSSGCPKCTTYGLVISSRVTRSEPRNVPLRLPRSSSTQTGPSARITACSQDTRASMRGMSALSSRPMRYSWPLSSRWVLRTVRN